MTRIACTVAAPTACVYLQKPGRQSGNALEHDAAPDAGRAERAPCLARPYQVTMRALATVLAPGEPEAQLPVVDG